MLNFFAATDGFGMQTAVLSRRLRDESRASQGTGELKRLFAQKLPDEVHRREIEAMEDPERWDGMS